MKWMGHDQAMRKLFGWTIAVGVNASLITGVVAFIAFKNESTVPTSALMLVVWASLCLYLLFGRGRRRASEFDVAMPIPARTLWLRHVIAVVMSGTVIMAGSLAVIWAHDRLLKGAVFDVRLLDLGLTLFAGLVVAATILEGLEPRLAEVRMTWTRGLRNAAILLGVGAIMLWLGASGPAWMVLPLALSLAFAAFVYRMMSPSLIESEIKPDHAGAPLSGSGGAALATSGSDPRWVWKVTLLRLSSAGGYKELLGVLFIALFGVMLGGGFGTPLADLRFLYVPMVVYMLFAITVPKFNRLHHLDPLPVSRRSMFAMLVGPNLLIITLAYGIGALAFNQFAGKSEVVSAVERDGNVDVSVPMRFCEIAWDGAPATVGSPWGESYTLEATPLYRGSRAALQCSFSVPEGSSKEFLALQVSRAANAVYGADIEPGEIADHYLTTNEDGRVAVKPGGLTIRKDYPDLRPQWGGPLFPSLMMLVVVPWLLLTALILRTYRGGISERVRLTMYWAPLGLLLGFFLVLFASLLLHFAEPWTARALVTIGAEAVGANPIGRFAIWGVAIGLVIMAYSFARTSFMKIEVPVVPTCYTLWDKVGG